MLLELCVYLSLALFVLLCASSFVLHAVRFNRNLERNITIECALHNVCMLFYRDAVRMPHIKKQYLALQSEKISYIDTAGNTLAWYFDQQRLMRSYSTKTGTEYTSALAPVNGSFAPEEHDGHIVALNLELSHNDKTKKITVRIA